MRIVRSARNPVRLAAGLGPDCNLTAEAIDTALRCLSGFAQILAEYRLDAVRVVGTNTLRVARNAPEFLPLAEKALGYPIEVISGEEEGRLVYMGVARAVTDAGERRLVIDIGGGSTEVIAGCGDAIALVESFSIGTQPQASRFFPDGRIEHASFDEAITMARAMFEDVAGAYRTHGWSAAYGSSGTMRAMAEAIARGGLGDGTLSLDGLNALRAALVECGHIDRVELPGLKPERVVAVLGGVGILIGAMQELGIERVSAINAGLRLGALSDLEMRAQQFDRRELAIVACMARFGVDAVRAQRTATIALHLYGQLGAGDESCLHYLSWACMLHEIGLAVSHTGAHKHGAYLVEHVDLPGFTEREKRLMATLVLGHKGNLRKIRDALAEPALARMVLALRLAVACMHARVDDELGGFRLRMKPRIEAELAPGWLKTHPTMRFWLERERTAWEEAGVGFQFREA
ncbi:Ppx/GppA family phosphatase [Massilia sp. CMS3.1]|uniref:Ppx/GppA phosphatase family protein n=1 Tax=Massilia sp. CMS3.1 TaxID=3373083 RepID=UPI003EE7A020